MPGRIPNRKIAEAIKRVYRNWKEASLDKSGYLPVFNEFKESFLLRDLSGGAIKAYLYLGLSSKQWTGETWVTIEQMQAYFGCSSRTISNWLKELQDKRLIIRMQLEINGVSYTYLRPYGEI